MANGGLQSVGFFVGYIALSLIIVAVVLPFWKMNDLSNEVKIMIHSLCEPRFTPVNYGYTKFKNAKTDLSKWQYSGHMPDCG